jgi:choline-sulfatase
MQAMTDAEFSTTAGVARQFPKILLLIQEALLLGIAVLVPKSLPAQNRPTTPVILISVDTLRADHLSCYGYSALRTSNIDALTVGGTLFSQTSSQVPLTLPSHVSLLTSTLPFHNGVQDHGQFLISKVSTLAEVLKSHGYRTSAFVGGFVLDKRFGLDRGFDLYDSPFNLRRQRRPDPGDVKRSGDEVVRSACQWLQKNSASPFFLFLHVYDLHLPYEIPGRAARADAGGYDEALAYEDQVVGRFLTFLRQEGIYGKTLVVFTSDHGESLWEHGESTHGYFIYQSTLRVPLMIHWPAGTGAFPERIDRPASLLDIAPTVLQYLGIGRPAGFQGRGLIETGHPPGSSGTEPEIYSESVYARNHFGCARLRSLRMGRYKYVEAPRPEFYDLILDPDEKQDLHRQQKALAAAYRDRLRALESRYRKAGEVASTTPSPEVVAALNSLGYVAVSTAKPVDRSDAADPKDRVADFETSRRALDLSGMGKTSEAQALLEPLALKYPEVADLQISLGLNLQRLGRSREAVDVFTRVLKQDPLNVRAHFDLGTSLLELKQYDEALKEMRAVLALSPTYNRAQELVGVILLSKGEEGAARAHFGQLLKIDPGNYAAHYHLGLMANRKGDWLEAERQFRAAAESDPLSAEAQSGLGVSYLQSGNLEPARQALIEAIRLQPNWADTHFNLGLVYRLMGRKDEAAQSFRAALAVDPQFRPAREALDSPEFRVR